jgi:hypothetical protein
MRFFWLASLLLFLQCSVNMKITVPNPPANTANYLVIKNSIPEEIDHSENLTDDPTQTSGKEIYAIIKLSNITQSFYLIWKWYGPDQKLVKQSEPIIVNENKKYLQYAIIWDNLPAQFSIDKKGTWKIALFQNDVFLCSRQITLH